MRGAWSGYAGGGAKPYLRPGMQGRVGGPCPPVRLGLPVHRPSRISDRYSSFQAG